MSLTGEKMLDVVGPAEIADMFGVHPVTVSKWQREGILPEPDAELRRVNVWKRSTLLEWAEKTGRQVNE